VYKQFSDGLLGAVGGLRRLRNRLINHGRQRAAKAGDRTGEDQSWWAGESAARLKHRQGAVQVDTHTQVEVGFGRRAHDRGEVEDTGSAVINDLGQSCTVRDVPGGHVQT
jgi:hypothetical protein